MAEPRRHRHHLRVARAQPIERRRQRRRRLRVYAERRRLRAQRPADGAAGLPGGRGDLARAAGVRGAATGGLRPRRLRVRVLDMLTPTMRAGGQVYTPYSCLAFDIRADGTAATGIEHIVALAEAHDSGLAAVRRRDIAADLNNLTIADPRVNRRGAAYFFRKMRRAAVPSSALMAPMTRRFVEFALTQVFDPPAQGWGRPRPQPRLRPRSRRAQRAAPSRVHRRPTRLGAPLRRPAGAEPLRRLAAVRPAAAGLPQPGTCARRWRRSAGLSPDD